jgi:hypothetical protein
MLRRNVLHRNVDASAGAVKGRETKTPALRAGVLK